MKFIRMLIVIPLLLILIACQEDVNEGRLIVPATITFEDDFIHYTNEDKPSLTEGVTVSHNYYENLLDLIIIDDTRVDWNTQGIYQINYSGDARIPALAEHEGS